jgi:hypothetical protein
MVMDLTKQKSKFVLLLYVCLEKINTGIGIWYVVTGLEKRFFIIPIIIILISSFSWEMDNSTHVCFSSGL